MTRDEQVDEARKCLADEELDLQRLSNHIIWLKGYIAGLKFEEDTDGGQEDNGLDGLIDADPE